MKTTLSIIGLLLLVGCTAKADNVTSWGTHYVINPEKVTEIVTEEKRCLQRLLATDRYDLDQTRERAADCYFEAQNKSSVGDDPKVYYFYTDQQENGESPFQNFEVCVSWLSSPMWDFPEDYTLAQYRQVIQDCLDEFPAE